MGKHLIKSYFNLGIEFLNCDCIDMTRLTPIIQINQGNTRSATVKPGKILLDMTRLTPIIHINQGNTRSATVKPGKILYRYDQAHSHFPDIPGEYQIW